MIEEIRIQNLGVIAAANLELREGFTVLTGETGAGKTMLLTALGLVLGQRADANVIRAGTDKTAVDASFQLSGDKRRELLASASELADLLGVEAAPETDQTAPAQPREATNQAAGSPPTHEKPLESVAGPAAVAEDDPLILSRTVTASRSRAYVNHRPATAATLAAIRDQLVLVHGQADQVSLTNTKRQLELLDRYAAGMAEPGQDLLGAYRAAWARAVAAKRALDEFVEHLAGAREYRLAVAPVIESIDQLDLHPGEDEELAAQAERITHFEQLSRALVSACEEFDDRGEMQLGIVTQLGSAQHALTQIQHLDAQIPPLTERLEQLTIEAHSLLEDLRGALASLDADPQRLEWIQQRRQTISRLLRGRALDVAELLQWAQTAREELANLDDGEARREQLQEALRQAQHQVVEVGQRLSDLRRRAARELGDQVTGELAGLSMKDARVEVQVTKRPKPGAFGLDEVSITLQPHPSMKPMPLGSGASGGELSRVMLALEVSLAQRGTQGGEGTDLTYIFDEVDAGIGGATAQEVGARLAALAKGKQVVVVTHLAQVAAWADHHVLIQKQGATTTVSPLEGEQRVRELARMLSGNPDSIAARAHAAELLGASKVAQS